MDSCHFAHSSKLSFVVDWCSYIFYHYHLLCFILFLWVYNFQCCFCHAYLWSDYWIVVLSLSRIGWGDGGVWSDLICLFYLCLFVMGPHCDRLCISTTKSNIISWLRSISFFHDSFLVLERSLVPLGLGIEGDFWQMHMISSWLPVWIVIMSTCVNLTWDQRKMLSPLIFAYLPMIIMWM